MEVQRIELYIPFEALPDQHFLAHTYVVETLRQKGIPVIGPVGVISVEVGNLTMSVEYDGEQSLCFRWVGPRMRVGLRKRHYTLEKTLAQAIEEEDDL